VGQFWMGIFMMEYLLHFSLPVLHLCRIVPKNSYFQIFYTWVDQRPATYMKLDELKKELIQPENVNFQSEMEKLVALVWGKKKSE
jgi:hypothetical protein